MTIHNPSRLGLPLLALLVPAGLRAQIPPSDSISSLGASQSERSRAWVHSSDTIPCSESWSIRCHKSGSRTALDSAKFAPFLTSIGSPHLSFMRIDLGTFAPVGGPSSLVIRTDWGLPNASVQMKGILFDKSLGALNGGKLDDYGSISFHGRFKPSPDWYLGLGFGLSTVKSRFLVDESFTGPTILFDAVYAPSRYVSLRLSPQILKDDDRWIFDGELSGWISVPFVSLYIGVRHLRSGGNEYIGPVSGLSFSL